MKILILADQHDDFWAEAGRDPFAGCEDLLDGVEALVLAGDLANKPQVRWKQVFARLRARFGDIPIFAFPGNHDFYNWHIDREDRLAEIAAEWSVVYAQKKGLRLGATRLLCCTLWTDLALGPGRVRNGEVVPQVMTDYRMIRHAGAGYRRVRPSDLVAVHHEHRAWLDGELAQAFDGPTVMVTHHAPHPDVLPAHAEGVDAAYASDLSTILMGPHAPDLWLFGHAHDARDLRAGRAELRCVSLGYPDEVETGSAVRNRIGRAILHV